MHICEHDEAQIDGGITKHLCRCGDQYRTALGIELSEGNDETDFESALQRERDIREGELATAQKAVDQIRKILG